MRRGCLVTWRLCGACLPFCACHTLHRVRAYASTQRHAPWPTPRPSALTRAHNPPRASCVQDPIFAYKGGLFMNFYYSNNGARLAMSGQSYSGENQNDDSTWGLGNEFSSFQGRRRWSGSSGHWCVNNKMRVQMCPRVLTLACRSLRVMGLRASTCAPLSPHLSRSRLRLPRLFL